MTRAVALACAPVALTLTPVVPCVTYAVCWRSWNGNGPVPGPWTSVPPSGVTVSEPSFVKYSGTCGEMTWNRHRFMVLVGGSGAARLTVSRYAPVSLPSGEVTVTVQVVAPTGGSSSTVLPPSQRSVAVKAPSGPVRTCPGCAINATPPADTVVARGFESRTLPRSVAAVLAAPTWTRKISQSNAVTRPQHWGGDGMFPTVLREPAKGVRDERHGTRRRRASARARRPRSCRHVSSPRRRARSRPCRPTSPPPRARRSASPRPGPTARRSPPRPSPASTRTRTPPAAPAPSARATRALPGPPPPPRAATRRASRGASRPRALRVTSPSPRGPPRRPRCARRS